MGRFAVVTCALFAACFVAPDRPGNRTSDGGIDSSIDAPAPICATQCAWACVAGSGSPHCGTITPAGGAVVDSDLDTTGLADGVSIDGTIDGDTGSIGTARTAGSGIKQGIEYKVVNNVAVFRFGSVTVSGHLTLAGSHPIAVVAGGAITLVAAIDGRGDCIDNDAGPGGLRGGARGAGATGSGAGALGTGTSCGGGGGGHAGIGGAGGAKNQTPAPGGAVFGDDAVSLLAGGGGGGGGIGSQGGFGGGGGGAIQLVSSTSITVMVSAEINAGGCGGKPTVNSQPGGGGGAGGTIVLEAPVVTIDGPIGTNGGGGAGGDALGMPGQDAITELVGATGGTSGMSTQTGGSGAAGSDVDGVAAIGGAVSSGGGGGAAGRIRITTKTGQIAGTATITPSLGSRGAKLFTASVH